MSQYTFTLRMMLDRKPGVSMKAMRRIARAGGKLKAMDPVSSSDATLTRDVTVAARNVEHANRITRALTGMAGVKLVNVSDRIFLAHLGGKIEVISRTPVKTRDDLSMVYTPGVADVCRAIHHEPDKVRNLTMKKNMVAIVTDGTAVLGLGDIGPEAALPVMEGKAMLFKEFAGVNAFPICLATKNPEEIVRTVEVLAPGFGGVNLEDISAPRCFEIEDRLKERLDIPVFHDDQHGTAVVMVAALLNALKLVKKAMEDLTVVVQGAGAAGMACAKMMRSLGVRNIIMCDRHGTLYRGRVVGMNSVKEQMVTYTNPYHVKGDVEEAMRGADVFVGLSGPDTVKPVALKWMARDPIVFAMSNPDPEIMPEKALPFVRVMATGRSDYPNQINNALCFPGFFRGLLDCGAKRVTEAMKVAAARAIAEIVAPGELDEEYIIPSIFNKEVAPAVARAVIEAARAEGVVQAGLPEIVGT